MRLREHGSTAAAFLIACMCFAGCSGGKDDANPPGLPQVSPPQSAMTPGRPTDARPTHPFNVLLISIDTLRADHLAAYGYERGTSPHIDDLALGGVLFERAYSQSPKTAPSHMTMMTGLHPASHRVRNANEKGSARLDDDVPTLATLLRRAGYRTRAYTGGGNVRRELGFDQGFDVYEHIAWPEQPFTAAGNAIAELAVGVREAGTPFFVFVHTYEVHDPYSPPEGYAERFADPTYDGRIIGTREALIAAAGRRWEARHGLYWSRVDPRDPREVQRLRDLYDGSIALVDDWIGGLLARIDQLGLGDSTLVVVVSDHGEEFREHGAFLHDSVFQEVLHVPLVMRLPGARFGDLRGVRVPQAVRLVDLLPTVLDAVGLPIPGHVQGSSLLPVVANADGAVRPILAEWELRKLRALQIGRWKIVRGPGGTQLYDLIEDPSELRDVAGQHVALTERLESTLATMRDAYAQFLGRDRDEPAIELDEKALRELKALGYL